MGEARRRLSGEDAFPPLPERELKELRLRCRCPRCLAWANRTWWTGWRNPLTPLRRRLIEGRPDPTASRHLDAGGGAVLRAGDASPLWVHRRLYRVARELSREEGYFPLYPIVRCRRDLRSLAEYYREPAIPSGCENGQPAEALLLLDDGAVTGARGAVLGGTVIQFVTWATAPACWCMYFAWLGPHARRRGVLTALWPALLARYGDFVLRRPLSPAMRAAADRLLTPRQREIVRWRHPVPDERTDP